jgi:hypothetical protein
MEHERHRTTHAWVSGEVLQWARKIWNSNKFFEENIALLAVENRWSQIKSHLPETSTHSVAEQNVGRMGELCYSGHQEKLCYQESSFELEIGKGHWYLPSNRIIKLRILLEDSQF